MRATLRDLVIGLVLAALVASLLRSSYFLDVAAYAGVLAIFALGVAVTFGQLGYASFGHAAFLGLGAYAAGLLTASAGLNYWAAVPLAVLPGVLLGTLVGFASARLSGAYFAIATLVVAEVLMLVAANWVDLTRGPMGLMVMAPALPLSGVVGWNAQQGYLFAVLGVLCIAFLLMRNLRVSATGRAWSAIREAPALAESLGIDCGRSRTLNVAISGGLSALAGALLVPKVMVLTPTLFGVQNSATGLLAVILGGKGTLLGPMLGGALFAALPEALRFMGELNFAAFAVLLLVAVRLLPGGIGGLFARPARGRSGDEADARSAMADVAGVDTTAGIVAASSHAGAFRPGMPPRGGGAAVGEAVADVAVQRDDAVVLSVRDVSRHFKGLKAVEAVSFDVARGEIVGLIGPNGAGKTTLLTMLSGFMAPSRGTVKVMDVDIAGLAPSAVARRGVVRTFQQTAVCATLSVAANMRIAAHLYRPPSLFASMLRTPAWRRRERERFGHALRCLAEVGLSARVAEVAGALPYGEQKLLGVAMALAAQPSVLLLDEPAAGLNQVEAQRLAGVLRALRDKGLTLVVVDHNLKMLMSLVDRVVVLHHGMKLADGLPDEVVGRPDVVAAYLGTRALAPAVAPPAAMPDAAREPQGAAG